MNKGFFFLGDSTTELHTKNRIPDELTGLLRESLDEPRKISMQSQLQNRRNGDIYRLVEDSTVMRQ
jgi:hypothetical protein